MIGNDTGDFCCEMSVVSSGMSGRPVGWPLMSLQASMSSTLFRNSAVVPTIAKSFWHAWMIALRVSSALSLESMKSTTTLRFARPPFELMYLPKPCTASADPLNRPGASGVFTSAMTAMWISVGLTPTSLALGASLALDWPDAVPAVNARATPTAVNSATQRNRFTNSPLDSGSDTGIRAPRAPSCPTAGAFLPRLEPVAIVLIK